MICALRSTQVIGSFVHTYRSIRSALHPMQGLARRNLNGSIKPITHSIHRMAAINIEEKFNAQEPVDLRSYSDRWEAIWAAGLQPGQVRRSRQLTWPVVPVVTSIIGHGLFLQQRFDCGDASPALMDLMASKLDVKGKRVLVPGCG